MNILMSVFSKLFFTSYNSNVALFNHERQLIIVKLLKVIVKILQIPILQITADSCRCRFLQKVPIFADAD